MSAAAHFKVFRQPHVSCVLPVTPDGHHPFHKHCMSDANDVAYSIDVKAIDAADFDDDHDHAMM